MDIKGKPEPRRSSSSLSPTKLLRDDASFLAQATKAKLELSAVPNGEAITALYSQLNSCITDLDQKVGTVLKKHEIDFLNVYKGHMFSVQKEMRLLKEKASEEENKRRLNDDLLKLQQERDWFRNEAVRLDKLCKDYKQSVSYWKAKAAALEEDRQFLQSQVMTAQKFNSKSQEQLESLQLSYGALQESVKEVAPDSGEKLPSTDQNASLPTVKKQAFVTAACTPDSGEADEVGLRYKGTIQHLKHQIRAKDTALRRIKSVKTGFFLERGELEDFFLDCIEEVRKSIFARRMKGAQLLSRSASKVLDRESASKPNIRAVIPESLEDVKLASFTDSDKRKVIDLLLSNDSVLLLLHRSLFPEKRSQSVTRIVEPQSNRGRATPGKGAKLTPGRPTYPRHSLFKERQ